MLFVSIQVAEGVTHGNFRKIVVTADGAHRSQTGFNNGFARSSRQARSFNAN